MLQGLDMWICVFNTTCRLRLSMISKRFDGLRLTCVGLGLLITTVSNKPCLPTKVRYLLPRGYMGSRILNSHFFLHTFAPHVAFLMLSPEDALRSLRQAAHRYQFIHCLLSYTDHVPLRSRFVIDNEPSTPIRRRLPT